MAFSQKVKSTTQDYKCQSNSKAPDINTSQLGGCQRPSAQRQAYCPADSDRKRRIPTGFSGDLDEGLHAALPIVALRGQRGHVVPLHGGDDVHHGLGLVGVRRYHAGEEVVAAVVAQLGRRRGVADLRDLRDKREESGDVLETVSPGL